MENEKEAKVTAKPQLRAFSVRIPEEQYLRILKAVREGGYGTVVEFIREAIREKLERIEHGDSLNNTLMRNPTMVVRDLSKLREDLKTVFESLDSLVETLEILSDKELMESIKRSQKDVEEGRVKDFEVKKVLRSLRMSDER